jgi:hypothetical protein
MIFDILSSHWIVQAIVIVVIGAVCLAALAKQAAENRKKLDHLHQAENHPRHMEIVREDTAAKLERAKLETSVALAKYGAEQWKEKNAAIEHRPS